jgi:hypothetical protein
MQVIICLIITIIQWGGEEEEEKVYNSVSLPDDLTAAVALRIISRRLTERAPNALVITLIDSSPELLLLLLPSGGQKQIYTQMNTYTNIFTFIYLYINT